MSPAKQWERENEERSEKMALEEILEIARKNGACKVQLAAAEKHASLASLLADPNAPRWAWWLRGGCPPPARACGSSPPRRPIAHPAATPVDGGGPAAG